MIKVNLYRTTASSGGIEAGEGFAAISEKDIQKQGFIKLAVIMVFPIALFLYESQNIPGKKSELKRIQGQVTDLASKNNKAKGVLEEIKKFEADQEKLKLQIASIESLSKDRLLEVRVLDAIQKTIPQKVWLNKIDFNGAKMNIIGNSTNDIDLTNFMDSLSRLVFLKEVSLVRAQEASVNGLTVKKFEINCLLERI